jgi:hypothetical protein
MYGHLTCKECGQRFSSPINSELNISQGTAIADWQIYQQLSMSIASKLAEPAERGRS